MALRTTYRAPWSWELYGLTAAGLFAVGLPIVSMLLRGADITALLLGVVLLAIAATSVRRYEIAPDALMVRRLFWTTRMPLNGTVTATVRPRVMAGSWRLFGNGGFFAFSGRYSNAALGYYRAFVTDFNRTVVLTTPQGLVVVSPDDPDEFARAVIEITHAVS